MVEGAGKAADDDDGSVVYAREAITPAEQAVALDIRRRRLAAGLSQNALAILVGHQRQYISRAEQPTRGLPSENLVAALDPILKADGELMALWATGSRERRRRRHEVLDLESSSLRPNELSRERFRRDPGLSPPRLGRGTAARTAALPTAGDTTAGVAFPYAAPTGVIGPGRDFLTSSARVLLVSGSAGTGKTSLMHHLAREFAVDTDCQLHDVRSWALVSVDIAAEILRYASIPGGDDALLTLEEHSTTLDRPCLVVLDGIDSHSTFSVVGRQIDAILRQVTSAKLRFLLTVRTPPDVETTAHPLLHTLLFRPTGDVDVSRYILSPWSADQARRCWQAACDQPFDSLPPGVQQLVRTPLYMKLALNAPPAQNGDDLSAYELLDHSVRRLLGNGHVEHRLSMLTVLARHQAHTEVPTALSAIDGVPALPELPADLPATIVDTDQSGRRRFAHDVLREYFLSTYLAHVLAQQGRSITTVQALNEMADRAATSGTARSVFALVVQRLDSVAPTLLEAIATAPTASATSMLPLLIATSQGARFVTPEVLRACAVRAEHDADPSLARALLSDARRLHHALGNGRHQWILALLQRFGTSLWPEITTFVETTFDDSDARTLLDTAHLTRTDEATFFARHFYLFFADASDEPLEVFLGHLDWRVRAALAEALDDGAAALDDTGLSVMARLVQDADYKVRAVVAPVVVRASGTSALAHLTTLLNDENWHVRERALYGLDRLGLPPRRPDLVRAALDVVNTEPSWSYVPVHVRPHRERLRLLHTLVEDDAPHARALPDVGAGDHRALLTILREIRTGHLVVPQDVRARLLRSARCGDRWLVQREAERMAEASGDDDAPYLLREEFRRTRGLRKVQIALDLHDIHDALRVARAAADAGADFIEVGDPLIKQAGIRAIEKVKAAVNDTLVIAEMMSADWGRDQVVLAAEAGADIVQLIGPATTASVRAAVNAGQRLGVPVVLDVPVRTSHRWIIDMERAGVDGLVVTTNIDIGVGSTTPLDATRTFREWTALPVAVSGGFSTVDGAVFASPDWDILIVGRGVTDAVDPATAAKNLVELVHLSGRHL